MFDRNPRRDFVVMQKRISGTLSVTAAALIFGLSGPAAAAVFSASSIATLTVTDISSSTGGDLRDLSIIADDFSFIEDAFVISPLGNAGGNADAVAQVIGADPDDLGIDDAVTQTAAASGFATGKRPGAVDAFAFASTSIEILNNSLADIFTVEFLLAYELNATSEGDDAIAIVDINAASSFGTFSLFDEVVFDPSNGFFDAPLSRSIPFSLEVGAGEDQIIFVETNAEGSARSVPLPSALLLMLPGLVALVRYRQGATP